MTDTTMTAPQMRKAKFSLGSVVRHRIYPFRGVVFDVDPVFDNTEEWWLAIPEEIRPRKDQPFYHLLAENAETEYVAYVSEQNLVPDTSGEALRHAGIAEVFERDFGWRVSHARAPRELRRRSGFSIHALRAGMGAWRLADR